MKPIILEPRNSRNFSAKPPPRPRQVNAHEIAHLVECLYPEEHTTAIISQFPALEALLYAQSEESNTQVPVTVEKEKNLPMTN